MRNAYFTTKSQKSYLLRNERIVRYIELETHLFCKLVFVLYVSWSPGGFRTEEGLKPHEGGREVQRLHSPRHRFALTAHSFDTTYILII